MYFNSNPDPFATWGVVSGESGAILCWGWIGEPQSGAAKPGVGVCCMAVTERIPLPFEVNTGCDDDFFDGHAVGGVELHTIGLIDDFGNYCAAYGWFMNEWVPMPRVEACS